MEGTGARRTLLWAVGLIGWLAVLYALAAGAATLFASASPSVLVLGVFAVELALSAALGALLSRRLAIPRAIWALSAVGAALRVAFSAYVLVWSFMWVWLQPSGAPEDTLARAASELGFELTPLAVAAVVVWRALPLIACAIAGWWFSRTSAPAPAQSTRPRWLRPAVAAASVVVLVVALGGLWWNAKSILEVTGYAEVWETAAAGQTISLADGAGAIEVLPGWGGDITVVRELPAWTGLSGSPPFRELVMLTTPPGGVEVPKSARVLVVVMSDQDEWQRRYEHDSSDCSATVLPLPSDVLTGRERVAYLTTRADDSAAGGWQTWVSVYVSDPETPIVITCIVDHESADPPVDEILTYLRTLDLPAGAAAVGE